MGWGDICGIFNGPVIIIIINVRCCSNNDFLDCEELKVWHSVGSGTLATQAALDISA